MSNYICFAQNVDEIQFILKNTKKKLTVVPLDLGVQLYCIHNKIEFIDPIILIKNSFHLSTINESYHFLNNLNYHDVLHESHQKELKAFLRFRFHLIAFLNWEAVLRLPTSLLPNFEKLREHSKLKNQGLFRIILQ